MSNLPVGTPYFVTCEYDAYEFKKQTSGYDLNNFWCQLPEPLVLPYMRSWVIGLCQISCDYPTAPELASKEDIAFVFLEEAVTPFNAGGCISCHTVTASDKFKTSTAKTHFYEAKNVDYHLLKGNYHDKLTFRLRRKARGSGGPADLFDGTQNESAKVVITLAIRAMDIDARTESIPMVVGNFASYQSDYPSNRANSFQVALPESVSQLRHKNWYLGMSSVTFPTQFKILPEDDNVMHSISINFPDDLPEALKRGRDMGFEVGLHINAWRNHAQIRSALEEAFAASLIFKIGSVAGKSAFWSMTYLVDSSSSTLLKDTITVKWSKKLARVLGIVEGGAPEMDGGHVTVKFKKNEPRVFKFSTRAFVPDRAFVFCDAVEPSMLGSRMQRVLGVVPIWLSTALARDLLPAHQTHSFSSVMHHRLTNRSLSNMKFTLGDSEGRPLPFYDAANADTAIQAILKIEK